MDTELPSDWITSKRGSAAAAAAPAVVATPPSKKHKHHHHAPPAAAAAAPPPPPPQPAAETLEPMGGPMGPRSVFNASAHAAPERGQLREMVMHNLETAPYTGGEGEETVKVDCLLCSLPYKKMLSDLHGANNNNAQPQIPYVTRTYEESFMREVAHTGERKCAKGKQCECMFINPEQPFIGVEFLLPGERQPQTPHMCVLCCRAVTQQLYYDVMFDKQVEEGWQDFGGVIQRFGNMHSCPGEYALDAMLIAAPTAPLHAMPLPIVSHQRNRYTVVVHNGIKYLKQSRVSVQWDVSPLFAHWRHRPTISVRKGCSTPPALVESTSSSSQPLFCTHNAAFEKLLRPLHTRLRSGERQYQSEIDRYLFAVISPHTQHLILQRNSVPHYDNLPDLSYYVLGILDPCKDAPPEVQQIFLMLRQCTPLRRRTKRAQRELQWNDASLKGMQVSRRTVSFPAACTSPTQCACRFRGRCRSTRQGMLR